ncbi:hypothetical protein E2C01_092470 [Portunus trituberculatus]|uniref:Uncharacterized protein n=1 Tax=Portunus trituberculatus TaxID=210409 RepID=A0A5B7JM15_PORTR|nr:hypothetical protein [Portunus trituberculatus]
MPPLIPAPASPLSPHSDLGQTRLVCDCGLTWLAEAVMRREVRVHSASKCFSPRALNNTQIKKLKPEQLLCRECLAGLAGHRGLLMPVYLTKSILALPYLTLPYLT